MTEATASAPITPNTRFSAPIVALLAGFSMFGGAAWHVFTTLDNIDDQMREAQMQSQTNFRELTREVSDLRLEVARLSNSNIQRHEFATWIELMRMAHPEVKWHDPPPKPQ